MNPLDTTVSLFANYATPDNPVDIPLMTFLRSKKYRRHVEAIRAEPDKKRRDRMKAQLPAITPSGTFTRRGNDHLIRHSGLICIDLDGKDNPGVMNWREICRLPEVAYLGLSVSGKGYWALIPLADPKRHTEHFRALQRDFSTFGLTIDEACGDPARLRGYSFDAQAYFNPNATPYERVYVPKREVKPYKPRVCQARQDGEKPGDAFNRSNNILDLAEADGWAVVRERGNVLYVNRPGASNPKGIDGTVFTDRNILYVFSTSADLEAEKSYSPFAYLTHTRHGGDFSACARSLSGVKEKTPEPLPTGWHRNNPWNTLIDADGIPAIWGDDKNLVVRNELKRLKHIA